MSQRRYYLALLGMMIIMMSGVTLLLVDNVRRPVRNPDDVVWMERIRRNALSTLTPIRERIEIVHSPSPAIRVGGFGGVAVDKPAVILFEPGDPDLPMEILMTARDDVLKTSGWHGENPDSAPPSPPNARHLFELKDHLWEVTLNYIDTLILIYGREIEVPSSRVAFLEDQLMSSQALLDNEITRLGLEPVN